MNVDLQIPGYTYAKHHPSVASTMDSAREALGCLELSDAWAGLVVADHQEAGRGRQGRRWLSGEDACMLTCIFCTAAGHAEMSGYSLAVGLAIAQAFEQRGVRFQLKWPNDLVVVQGQAVRKLGGILIEVEEYQGRRVLLVGLGINVRQVPSEVSDIAISLAELCRDTICRDEVVQIVASAALVNHRSFFESGGFSRVQSAWEDRSCFEIGQTELTLETGAGQVKGLYAGVSQSGALTLCRDDEQRQVFHSGHIASSGGVFKDLSKRC